MVDENVCVFVCLHCYKCIVIVSQGVFVLVLYIF